MLVRGRWIVTGGAEADPVLNDAAVRVENGSVVEIGDWATLLSAARLLRTGVTSVVDVHSDRGTAEVYAANAREALAAYDTAGIRVAFAAEG